MKRVLFTLLLAGVSVLGSAQSDPITITNVTIVDVTGGPPLLQVHRTVVIRDGKIAEVHYADRAAVKTKHTLLVNGTGKFLIPGLWDMHVHEDLATGFLTPEKSPCPCSSPMELQACAIWAAIWKCCNSGATRFPLAP